MSFSNRDVGIKVPLPCLLVQVAVAQTCHFLFFQAEMLNDPEFAKNVGLERMLRVRDSACSGFVGTVSSGSRVVADSRCAGDSSAGFLDPGAFSGGENNSVNAASEKRRCDRVASAFAGETSPEGAELVLVAAGKTDPKDTEFVLAVAGETDPENAEMALAAAGETDPEDAESVRSLAGSVDRELRRSGPSVRLNAHATACESTGIIGMVEVIESDFPSLSYSVNSCPGLSTSACARASRVAAASAGAAARVCAVSSSCAVSAVARAHASTLHGAHNSWSDTVRLQGPRRRRCTIGWVSGLAEDLRPVSEVEAGANFRPAGSVRGQVPDSLPRRQPGTGTRQGKRRVVTPSLHPEVPGIQFVSPGYGLDIRQSMGWTKVCGTARSGIC